MKSNKFTKSKSPHKRHHKLKVFFTLFLLLCVCYLARTFYNFRNDTYGSLNHTDKTILAELNTVMSTDTSNTLWKNYDIAKKTILALNGRFGKAYLINPSKEIHSIFAKEIQMPKGYSIKVYRISPMAPPLLQFIAAANFNTAHHSYPVYGNPVYFTKYDDDSVTLKHNSGHYMNLLIHEAFHYYMQNNWSDSGRFNTDALKGKNLQLLGEQYQVLQKIYNALIPAHAQDSRPDKASLLELAREYVSVTDKRFQADAKYMKEETQAETEEGTATYVEINAAKLIGYDYEIMQFADKTDDAKVNTLPFDSIAPTLQDNPGNSSIISTNIVYHSGALLCRLLDALEVPDWQVRLNQQTKEAPVTLYQILSDYVHTASQTGPVTRSCFTISRLFFYI